MKKARVLAAAIALACSSAFADAATEVTLDIKGMDCGACPLTVKVLLKKQHGVEEVVVAKTSAKVRFDPKKTTPEHLANVVTEAGFPAKARS